MTYKPFPPALLQELDKGIQSNPTPIVAFDADGTLWDTDLGESFFDFLIREKKIPLPPDPWKHYYDLQEQNPLVAYFWLAQILAPQSESLVQKWAYEHLESLNVPVFEPQKELIHYLNQRRIPVFIVTASIKWAIQPAAEKLLNLPPEQVIGIEVEIDSQGRLTTTPVEPATYREGKALSLLQKTGHRKPLLAMGNSLGDLHLLEIAQIPVAIRSSAKQKGLLQSELALQDLAQNRGWWIHSFLD